MLDSTAAPSVETDLPFRFVGGEAALDFVNTVDWTDAGPMLERLSSYERVIEWATESGSIGSEVAQRLSTRAGVEPHQAQRAFERSHDLRRVLQRLFTGIANGDSVQSVVSEFNLWLSDAGRRLRIAVAGAEAGGDASFHREFTDAGDPLEAPLWLVVWSAAELLASREIRQLRVCAAPQCGWVYVDRSRNGFRRWCQMETCGTRAKSERRRRRDRGSRPDEVSAPRRTTA